MQEFHRPRKQTIKVLINLAVVAGCGNIWDGLQGSTSLLIVGCVFLLWAGYIALNLVRRRVHVIASETGLMIKPIIGSPVQIQWQQVETARFPETASPAIIGWRSSDGTKLQYTGVSQRTLGEAGAQALRSAIFAARPDLVR